MEGLRLGFALSGSFCTFGRVLKEIQTMVDAGADVTTILSYNAASMDTRFGTADELRARLIAITGHTPLQTLADVEPIGPKEYFDVLVVAPCTGNTLGRLACGISDTPVTLAVKSHLRRNLPVVLAISTNDALGASMKNIAHLKNTKYIYLVPFRQDDPINKPNSLVADFSLIADTITAARKGFQLQPLFQ